MATFAMRELNGDAPERLTERRYEAFVREHQEDVLLDFLGGVEGAEDDSMVRLYVGRELRKPAHARHVKAMPRILKYLQKRLERVKQRKPPATPKDLARFVSELCQDLDNPNKTRTYSNFIEPVRDGPDPAATIIDFTWNGKGSFAVLRAPKPFELSSPQDAMLGRWVSMIRSKFTARVTKESVFLDEDGTLHLHCAIEGYAPAGKRDTIIKELAQKLPARKNDKDPNCKMVHSDLISTGHKKVAVVQQWEALPPTKEGAGSGND